LFPAPLSRLLFEFKRTKNLYGARFAYRTNSSLIE